MIEMSHKEYFQFLRDVESSLYDEDDFQVMKYDVYEDEDNGLVHTPYRGRERKSYSQPMIDIKNMHPTQHRHGCHRCGDDGTEWNRWSRDEDDVTRVRWYPTLSDELDYFDQPKRIAKEIHFIPFFAARWPHP